VTQAVRRRAFTAKTRVESQVAPYGIVVEKLLLRHNILLVSLFSEYLRCSLSVSFHRHRHSIPFQCIALTGTPGVHLPISKSDINFPLLSICPNPSLYVETEEFLMSRASAAVGNHPLSAVRD